MMTFLVLAFIGMTVAALLFVVMLPFMIIGGVLRLLTLPFRLLFWPFRRGPMFCGSGCGWGGPRWRRRGAYARW
jgi:hypothetical protein